MTKFEEKLEMIPIKIIRHPVGNAKYYAAVSVKKLIEQVDEEIANLKSQLQQQALPVVPECVGNYIEECKENRYALNIALDLMVKEYASRKTELSTWVMNNQEQFAKAWFGKYEVEKPQLFYLKNKLTRKYLRKSKHTKDDWNEDFDRVETVNNKTKFTQAEIESMDAGSYEKIEVME